MSAATREPLAAPRASRRTQAAAQPPVVPARPALAATRIAKTAPSAHARPGAIRTQGPRPIAAKAVGSFVPRLTKPAFERYGFSAAAIITDWETIVGADMARYTRPERLKWPRRVDWSADEADPSARGRPGATLVVAVSAGRALDIQYKARDIVDRINHYFGYRAIADLRIVQAMDVAQPDHTGTSPQTAARPGSAAPASAKVELTAVAEPGLRGALERMALGLARRSARVAPNP